MRGVLIRRASTRFHSTEASVAAWHCLSYGVHYDPGNTSFGVLVACNEFAVAPGGGFPEHRHNEMEIVSWVVAGALRHEDSTGHSTVVRPGVVQRLSAGTGVRHAETNPYDQPLRFIQMWVVPDERGAPPSYDLADLTAALSTGNLVTVVSGRPARAPLRLRQQAAHLHAARVPAGRALALPAAPYVHVYVASGDVLLAGGGRLGQGDEARLTEPAAVTVAAPEGPAEILAWEMHDRI